jgi:hypothetical protein
MVGWVPVFVFVLVLICRGREAGMWGGLGFRRRALLLLPGPV